MKCFIEMFHINVSYKDNKDNGRVSQARVWDRTI